MIGRLSLLFLATSLCGPPAFAVDANEAEHSRLTAEMKKLAARSAWRGVEESFQRLEALAADGLQPTYDDYLVGAQAAGALGHIDNAYGRLRAAAKIEGKLEVVEWMEEIEQNFRSVELSSARKEAIELTADQMPFAPDRRAAIAYAQSQVAETGGFVGRLPLGTYAIAGIPFSVEASQTEPTQIHVKPVKISQEGLAFVGPRGTLGLVYTAAGDSPGEAYEPAAFGGAGPRMGMGVEVGLRPHLAVLAEVGYHGLMAGADAIDGISEAQQNALGSHGDTLHLGYGWLAVSYRMDDFWLTGGPVWSAGSGHVTGANDYCISSPDPECQGASAEPALLEGEVLVGSVQAGGFAFSASYALIEFGKLHGALSFVAGAQTDSSRLYPWGELAFTFAPMATK